MIDTDSIITVFLLFSVFSSVIQFAFVIFVFSVLVKYICTLCNF